MSVTNAPIFMDNNNTLNNRQRNIINSLLVTRWNWFRTKFTQKQKSDAVATNNNSRNTARVFSLNCIEYFYKGIASFYLYSYGLKANKEYKLFEARNTPENITYNGIVGNYTSEDISEYGEIYFVDNVCYFKPNQNIEDTYAIITVRWDFSE